MATRKTIPPRFRVIVEEGVRIPMRDGVSLSARLVRPDADGRFPVVVLYHPYRKDDFDYGAVMLHRFLAERGLAAVQLDVRGTGSSDGFCSDEYLPVEQRDGYDAVEWLAAQSWCNGSVGMWGSSYSGFTAIQVAALRPPHLKAILPSNATDDRFTDDCHYTRGGSLRMYYDVGTYGGFMVAMNAMPPAESDAGADWAERWVERLEKSEPFLLNWLANQTDGGYWRGGSLRPDYGRIQCPVYLVGGWRDGYVNAMLRMYRELQCPKWILIGPWPHNLPHSAVPGPSVDFPNEMLRFFLYALAGEDTGFGAQPGLTVYMQEQVAPDRTAAVTPGHWREDDSWPPSGHREWVLHLGAGGGLHDGPMERAGDFEHSVEYFPGLGTANGYWSGGGLAHYLAGDQRVDEAYSLTYTSDAVEEDTHLLGWPELVLCGASSVPVLTFVAKLSDVAPDGTSILIVDGSLNGTRRESMIAPSPLEPGTFYELRIPMTPTGWVLRKGHRVRLAVSASDFPNLWPAPQLGRLTLKSGAGFANVLKLPVVQPASHECPPFAGPPPLGSAGRVRQDFPRQEIVYDQVGSTVTARASSGRTQALPDGTTIEFVSRYSCSVSSRNPADATVHGVHSFRRTYHHEEIEATANCHLRSSMSALNLTIALEVRRGGNLFFQRNWVRTEPRRLL